MEVPELLTLAAQADGALVPDGMRVPAELQRREVRLAAIAQAKAKPESRVAECFAEEQRMRPSLKRRRNVPS